MEDNLYILQRNSSNHIQWKKGQKEKIVELYKNGVSLRKISEKFGGHLHRTTISKVLEEYQVQKRTLAQSHYKDNRIDNYFSVIDCPEKAYWLGLIAADGCVNGNYLIIHLQREDEEILKKFKSTLKADSIKIQVTEKIISTGEVKQYSRFSIGCKQLVEDLKQYGICEQKTLKLKPPLFLKEEFYYDWIRGYFDGDGGISQSHQNKTRWCCYFNSTEAVLDWIQQQLQISVKPYQQKHNGKLDNVWRLQINGRLQTLKCLNLIYKDNSANLYLQRKYKKYLKLLETV